MHSEPRSLYAISNMLQLYDTLSGTTRPFEPFGPTVSLYVCGVTPYDTTHLGHAFTFLSFDTLIRYLRYQGHTVRYIQNVTDVDDPLFEKARQLGVSYTDLATEQTNRYLADMRALNVLPADMYPHASGEIAEMITLIESLVRTGNAYVVEGSVYFSIATYPEYGQLSKYNREEMITIARERGGNPDDPRRRDPLDFVLWRPSKADEPAWPSPWGDGLPGWHIECSAMSLKYLQTPLDIHGGGADLLYPHHESEIAQSEVATSVRPFARFWLHTGMVYLGGEKMSKSLGNMVFARDLLANHGSDAIRIYLLGYHYRSVLHYDATILERAVAVAAGIAEAAWLASGAATAPLDLAAYRDRFKDRMNNDLDTPGAVAVVEELANAIHTAHKQNQDLTAAQELLRELGDVLGLRLERPLPGSEA